MKFLTQIYEKYGLGIFVGRLTLWLLTYLQCYLVVGYYFTMSEEYDIKWTTPHCVLTLRLTGLAFDVYDGTKNTVSINFVIDRVILVRVPTLLSVLSA